VLRLAVSVPLALAVTAFGMVAGGMGGDSTRSAALAAKTVKVSCAAGGVGTTEAVRARDVVIGPVVLLGARMTTRHRPDAFNKHGYKVPVTVPEGGAATLSVPRRLRGRIGLVFSHRTQDRVWRDGVSAADSTVRFTACEPAGKPGRTGWAGGIAVDRRRCARLVVRVAGKPPVTRPVPLGRRCATRRRSNSVAFSPRAP
jgi:hypothetical protein